MNKPFKLHHGDCIEVMRDMPDNSVDSVVTDPPYELGFMGKKWDATGVANDPVMWSEVLRVLKPGGHLLAFSGSRTYHRMTCAIEDAGFDIRDQIMWVYSSGFPKSHNLDNLRGTKLCGCTNGTMPYDHKRTQQKAECNVRPMPSTDVSSTIDHAEERGQVLFEGMQEQGASTHARQQLPCAKVRGGQSSVEGRRDHLQEEGQLQGHPICQSAGLAQTDGTEGRLHHGASLSDGDVVRVPADSGGSGASRRPSSAEQRERQFGAVAGQPESQAMGAWPVCGRCLLPMVPKGLGTALKPAHEPICVARKPLVGTVAANVLAFGTGAINIDGCRVGYLSDSDQASAKPQGRATAKTGALAGGTQNDNARSEFNANNTKGRWPANLIHDGSAEVVALFPQAKSGGNVKGTEPSSVTNGIYGEFEGRVAFNGFGDSGSAARFFYCAKASRADRNSGTMSGDVPSVTNGATMRDKEDADWSTRNGNSHPTVKPTELMAYLCRLVTPPNGTVLDPFMGSGSTGKAAIRAGFTFIGIEREQEYIDIARARIEHACRVENDSQVQQNMELF